MCELRQTDQIYSAFFCNYAHNLKLCLPTTVFQVTLTHVVSFKQLCGFLMQFLLIGCLRRSRSQLFNVGFLPCPLFAEVSLDSLNLLMIFWIGDGTGNDTQPSC